MKILLAVDGSPYTKKMLAYMVNHGETFGASNGVTLLTVQPTIPPRARAALGKTVVDQYQHEEAEKVLSPVSKFLLRHDIDAKSEWKVGNPGEQIAKFADAGKFDLLVLGSKGRSALKDLLIGSVAKRVAEISKVPVLLVK